MNNKKNVLIKVAVALIVVTLSLIFIFKSGILNFTSIEKVLDHLSSYGKFKGLAYFLIFNVRTLFIFFPYSAMVILGGSLLGQTYGFAVSIICVFTSSTLAFYIARSLGKDTLNKLLRGKMKSIDVKVEQHGFKVILFMRLSALFPFDVLSYAAGLTKVKYKEFILATVIGMIPETLSLSMLGHNMKHPFSKSFFISIGLVLLTVTIPYFVSKYKKANK